MHTVDEARFSTQAVSNSKNNLVQFAIGQLLLN